MMFLRIFPVNSPPGRRGNPFALSGSMKRYIAMDVRFVAPRFAGKARKRLAAVPDHQKAGQAEGHELRRSFRQKHAPQKDTHEKKSTNRIEMATRVSAVQKLV